MIAAVVLALGAGFGAGVSLIISGLTSPRPEPRPLAGLRPELSRHAGRAALALAGGLVAFLATGWPVVAVAAAVGAGALPALAAKRRPARDQIARLEAIASWTEMLRDRLAGGGFFQSTIHATVPVAPPAIAPAVADLDARLSDPVTHSTAEALADFAEDLADPSGELVTVGLALWAAGRATDIGAVLASVADHTRQEVTMRKDIEADRSSMRTQLRWISGIAVALPVVLVMINHPYLHPYASAKGQIVLAVLLGLYAAALAWLARLARPKLATMLVDPRRVKP